MNLDYENIKQEPPENSFNNFTNIYLEETEFKNCNTKEEITDEMVQANDPIKVEGFYETNSEQEQNDPIFTSDFKLEHIEENIFLEQSSNYHNTNIDDDSINVEENYESENIFLTCRICGFCFNTKTSLKNHIKRVHQRDKVVKKHINSVHKILKSNGGMKNFNCEKCDEGFSDNIYLQAHVAKIHEGLKCFECDKVFVEKKYLDGHIDMVHRMKSNLNCDKCDQVFTDKIYLLAHVATVHEGLKCSECGQLFVDKKYLDGHITRVHRFQCRHKKCKIIFADKSSLNSHELNVHNNKLFQCETCDKAYRHVDSLNKHIKSAHKEMENKICQTSGKSDC